MEVMLLIDSIDNLNPSDIVFLGEKWGQNIFSLLLRGFLVFSVLWPLLYPIEGLQIVKSLSELRLVKNHFSAV